MSPETKVVFGTIPAAKERLRKLLLSSNDPIVEWNHLRIWVVTNDMVERPAMIPAGLYSASRVTEHNQMCSAVYGIASPLTQLPTFRGKFQNVMDMLAVRVDDPAPQPPAVPPPLREVNVRQPTTVEPRARASSVTDTEALARDIAERGRIIGTNLLACGVMTRSALLNMQDSVIALTACGVLDYAHTRPGSVRMAGVSLALQQSLRKATMDTLMMQVIHGADEQSVNAARQVSLDLYPMVRGVLEAFATAQLSGS
jgi:hypothetical protein